MGLTQRISGHASLVVGEQFARARRFLRSPMFPIFMIVFVDVLGAAITIPVLPLYAQGTFDASPRQITLLTSTFFLAQFFASPQLGRLSDRVGRRPVLIISQMGTCLALLLSGAAPALSFLYLARAVDGFTGGNVSVAQAYLGDITEPSKRARGMGIINAAFGSGFIFGPAFGALVAAYIGPRVPFFIAAGVSLVTITLSTFLLPESLTPERRQAMAEARAAQAHPGETRPNPLGGMMSLLRAPSVVLIMVIGFCSQFAFLNFQTTWVLWLEKSVLVGYDARFIQEAAGWIMTGAGFFGIATQLWLVGPLAQRIGEKAMVVAGVVARGLAWAVMFFLPLLAPILLFWPLISVGGGIGLPALMALLTYATPAERRGQAIGLFESVQNVGRILGPLVSGLLFEQVAPGAPMGVAALFSVLAVIASVALLRLKFDRPGDPA